MNKQVMDTAVAMPQAKGIVEEDVDERAADASVRHDSKQDVDRFWQDKVAN
ncbi:DUF1912 family protein [Streptococcus hyointestinalis]|uniref:DUF1912 family protein n=1 Tax=Streptococcus hyointestinalis TaxID=1337 RepID=UPI0024074346|nr:DUF1912 family protein [Streptococcus hyointestinalis]